MAPSEKPPCHFCDAPSVGTLYHDGKEVRVCDECLVMVGVGLYAAGRDLTVGYGRTLLKFEHPSLAPGLNRAERRRRARSNDS